MKNFLAFAGHMISGACYFIVFASVAIGLQLFVHFVDAQQMDGPIYYGLIIGEYALFIFDLILFIGFILFSFKNSMKEVWKD